MAYKIDLASLVGMITDAHSTEINASDSVNTATLRLEAGWHFIQGSNSTIASRAVSFNTPFANKVIFAAAIAAGYVGSSAPTSKRSGEAQSEYVSSSNHTLSGLTAVIRHPAGSNLSSSNYWGFYWLAIGY